MPAADVSFTAEYYATRRAGSRRSSPYRLLDTRASPTPGGAGPAAGAGPDPGRRPLEPAGRARPASTAVLLNVTTTNPAAAGYVQAFPCGTEPDISTVNFDPGQTAANLAIVRLPADGRVCFTSLVPTDLVVDVSGWYAPGTRRVGLHAGRARAGARHPPDPAAGRRAGAALQPGRPAGLPADATAALLNLTVTNPTDAGYVRAYPCGEEQDVSNVNYAAGQTVANLASVKVAAGGDVCFRIWAPTDLVVDLAGWYSPSGTERVRGADPSRLFDTRSTPGFARLGAGPGAGRRRSAAAPVPAGAGAVALNVTAAAPDADGYVAVYPCGTDPLVSNVNYRAEQVAAANLAVVKLPADGRICFRSFAADRSRRRPGRLVPAGGASDAAPLGADSLARQPTLHGAHCSPRRCGAATDVTAAGIRSGKMIRATHSGTEPNPYVDLVFRGGSA